MSGVRATPGATRPCAMFASCAAEPCDLDATAETLHRPDPDEDVWVPLCDGHRAMVGYAPVEYVVEIHGFLPGSNCP